MDVLLAHGYFLNEDAHERQIMKPYPPLGILYLSSYLKSRGFSVGVFDSTFQSMQEFGALLAKERPSTVGLYCNLMTKSNVLRMIRSARDLGANVVLGGPEPPFYAEEYLERGADVVVVGEGEKAMEELASELRRCGPHRLQHVSGIVFRDESGRMVRTPPRPQIQDLDALPFPDREAIAVERYLEAWREHHGYGSMSLICARGCPYHCDWCSHSVYGNTHRRRSAARVADELEGMIDRYRPDRLWYADDVFTIKPSWLFAYAAELDRRKIRIPFECISRADRLDDDVVGTLASMGCYRLWIGSESGSQRILDAMSRGVKVETVQEVTRLCQRHGIEVGMFIMLGYDGEEERDLAATVEHLKKAGPDVFLTTVAYAIKGTPFYSKVKDRIVAADDWDSATDRDLKIAGRHSRRYYQAATRWMVGEVSLHRERERPKRSYLKILKSSFHRVRGRVGMALWSREVEG